jgi:hypothetical protein
LISRDIVRGARDLVEQLDDAIAHLDARITGVEHKIAADLEKAKREGAAQELTAFADRLAAAVGSFEASIAPLAKAIPDVVGRTPYANLEFGRGVEQLLGEVERELRNVVASARSHCSALLTNEATMIRRPDKVEMLTPAPPVERLAILAYGNLKWLEGGELFTIPHWGFGSPPRSIGEKAIAAGWAVRQDDPIVARLREGGHSVGHAWHRPRADLCVDLDRDPLPRPPRGTLGQPLGLPADEPASAKGAIETTGPERVGVASAERVS